MTMVLPDGQQGRPAGPRQPSPMPTPRRAAHRWARGAAHGRGTGCAPRGAHAVDDRERGGCGRHGREGTAAADHQVPRALGLRRSLAPDPVQPGERGRSAASRSRAPSPRRRAGVPGAGSGSRSASVNGSVPMALQPAMSSTAASSPIAVRRSSGAPDRACDERRLRGHDLSLPSPVARQDAGPAQVPDVHRLDRRSSSIPSVATASAIALARRVSSSKLPCDPRAVTPCRTTAAPSMSGPRRRRSGSTGSASGGGSGTTVGPARSSQSPGPHTSMGTRVAPRAPPTGAASDAPQPCSSSPRPRQRQRWHRCPEPGTSSWQPGIDMGRGHAPCDRPPALREHAGQGVAHTGARGDAQHVPGAAGALQTGPGRQSSGVRAPRARWRRPAARGPRAGPRSRRHGARPWRQGA